MGVTKYDGYLICMTLIALSVCVGCGYHLRADGNPVGIEIKGLAIPLMESTSSVEGFEADFTGIIRDEFISHARVPLVPEEEADKVLRGKIYDISAQPLTYSVQQRELSGRLITHETTSIRRLKIRLDISLLDRGSGKVIWNDNSMEEEARFEVGSDPLINRYNQKQALLRIARQLAKRVYLKTMERF